MVSTTLTTNSNTGQQQQLNTSGNNNNSIGYNNSSSYHHYTQQQQEQRQQQTALTSATANSYSANDSSNYHRALQQQHQSHYHSSSSTATSALTAAAATSSATRNNYHYNDASNRSSQKYNNDIGKGGTGSISLKSNSYYQHNDANNKFIGAASASGSAEAKIAEGGCAIETTTDIVNNHNSASVNQQIQYYQRRQSITAKQSGFTGNGNRGNSISKNTEHLIDNISGSEFDEDVKACAAFDLSSKADKETPNKSQHSGDSDSKQLKPIAVSLAEAALLANSPPLKEQLSLLFPKCRPKQANNNNNSILNTSHNSNSGNTSQTDSLSEPFVEEECNAATGVTGSSSNVKPSTRFVLKPYDDLKSSEQLATPANPAKDDVPAASDKTSAVKNYYRSVNIITQSPPPPSTSTSVSSESLSSVTHRISTNPFLCGSGLLTNGEDLDDARHRFNELDESLAAPNADDDEDDADDLPIPTYPETFYYHTSTSSNSKTGSRRANVNSFNTPPPLAQEQQHSRNTIRTQQQQHQHRLDDMPRKRNFYAGEYPRPLSQQLNGDPLVDIGNRTEDRLTPSQSQNPFIRDNYWEPSRANMTAISENASVPTNAPALDADYQRRPNVDNESDLPQAMSSRRAYHQQQNLRNNHPVNSNNSKTGNSHPNADGHANYMNSHYQQQKQQQQQSHQLNFHQKQQLQHLSMQQMRLWRGPNSLEQDEKHLNLQQSLHPQKDHNSSIPPLADSLTANDPQGSGEHTQRQSQAPRSPCVDGLPPMASHYLFENDSKAVRLLNGSGITIASSRRRERDVREQHEVRDLRDIGQPQQENPQRYHQQQQQLLLQPQQQLQKQQYQHSDPSLAHVERQIHFRSQQQLQQQHVYNNNNKESKANHNDRRLSVMANGEVVVFNDIVESWQDLKAATETSSSRKTSPRPVSTGNSSSSVAFSSAGSRQLEGSGVLTVLDVKNEKTEAKNNGKIDDNSVTYKEHRKFNENSYTASLEARHGIIEYEGSPRRIGQMGHPQDDNDDGNSPPPSRNQQHNNSKTSQNLTTTNSPQQYPARPGFPKRILSPPRDKTPPLALVHSYNQNRQQQQSSVLQRELLQQDSQSPLQQEQHQPSVPQLNNSSSQQRQQTPTDNNAEDTSNDVSEIGTISDLTVPEAVSAAATSTSSTNAFDAMAITTTSTHGGPTVAAVTPATITSVLTIPTKSSTFDYLYEFSETRKVLEEFFKCPSGDEKILEPGSDVDSLDIQYEFHANAEREEDDDDDVDGDGDGDIEPDNDEDDDDIDEEDGKMGNLKLQTHSLQTQSQAQQQGSHYNAQQTQHPAKASRNTNGRGAANHQRRRFTGSPLMRDFDFFLDSASRSSGEQLDQLQDGSTSTQNAQDAQSNYRYSPETTDYESNCGDLDSLSGAEVNAAPTANPNYAAKYYASSMPVLEDGLSSGHTSDAENNNNNNCNNNNELQQQCTDIGVHHTTIASGGGISMLMDMKQRSHAVSGAAPTPTADSGFSTSNGLLTNGSPSNAGLYLDKLQAKSPNRYQEISSSTTTTTATTYMSKNDDSSPINAGINSSSCGTYESDTTGRDSVRSTRRYDNTRDYRDRELLGQSPSNNNGSYANNNSFSSHHSNSNSTSANNINSTNNSSNNKVFKNIDPDLDSLYSISVFHRSDVVQMTPPPPAPAPHRKPNALSVAEAEILQPTSYKEPRSGANATSPIVTTTSIASAISSTLNRSKALSGSHQHQQQQPSHTHRGYQTPVPPPIPERSAIQRHTPSPVMNSPVWLPRHLDTSANKSLLESTSDNHSKNLSADEDDIDTDLETDRLLGHQRLDDQGYYDENKSWETRKPRSLLSKISPKQQQVPSAKTRNGYNALLSSTPEIPPPVPPKGSKSSNSTKLLDIGGGSLSSSSEQSDKSPIKSIDVQDCIVTMGSPVGSEAGSPCIVAGSLKKDSDSNCDNLGTGILVGNERSGGGGGGSNSSTSGHSNSNAGSTSLSGEKKVKKSKGKEGGAVLIEGVLFRAKYLGSTQLVCEGQPTKSTRMMQAEEAVSRIKAPDGDAQPSTEVDLFISTEKIMVLNTDLKEIMMDHALRTISYIADIGDLVVLMARRRFVPQDIDDAPKPNRTPKMICHVFESDEAQFIAQSIGQAFQVAYMEFLKANGIEDHSFVKEMDYQEVLNSQEIFGDELEIFAKKELQKEVVVPKAKGEILGVVIVESGWGSMLPTVVIANLMSTGAAARCGQLNIGDQLIAINGLSLVGLPLSTCQNYIKNTKNQTVVKFTVVPCPPVVEVKIKRPNTKYQLGFSVQNGVICSLLRGGIAERGGVRVGHRIIEINNQSVVAVPHEKIVNLLATSVGEILMKTMPTSMFRLLTGQENPIYI